MERVVTPITDITSVRLPAEITDISKVLFVDIETTGFVARTSKLYLIGCAYHRDDAWHIVQFFSEDPSEEAAILNGFAELAREYETLVDFNGNTFDIPYLRTKFKEHGIDFDIDAFEGIDIYRRISSYKDFLGLENCRQKSVEKFLSLDREDTYTGGELIEVYDQFTRDKDPEKKHFLLLHNLEDVKGMLLITPILAYCELFNSDPTVTRVRFEHNPDINGVEFAELLIDFDMPSPVPRPVSSSVRPYYLSVTDRSGFLRVPVFEEELKYFFANYEDYYYLPEEDTALHKSVASFVEKGYREQAKPSTCYTKKKGVFLPEWEELVTPFFKRDYKSNELYFELTDELKTDREFFGRYVGHVLRNVFV